MANGLNSGNNPEVVKTSLDEVLKTEFDRPQQPQEVMATDPLFFRQDTIDRGAVIYAERKPIGLFEEHLEEETRKIGTIKTDNKTTTDVLNYKNTITIPEEFFDDHQHGDVAEMVQDFGRKARDTRDREAFRRTYADGFDGNVTTTPDGNSLYNNSHTALSGDTVDNLETGTLTPTNLETLVKSLRLQKDQNGDLGSHHADGLLVPVQLFPDAVEITKSELAANSAENNLNYFSNVYPGMRVGVSPYLDSAENTATNADTSYYLVSRNHRISRTVRAGLMTKLVPPDTDLQDRWIYKAGYREVVVPKTWEGTVASNGTV